ncbi:MAG: toprim domain-containing protein, partial [Oscillospiraceae bacterium]
PFLRGDIEGSSKEVGLFINNNSASLLVCEAPIDAMSLMSLLEHHKVAPEKYSYLAQGGVCLNSLEYHIKRQPKINTVYLCYDNDAAGHSARAQSRELLKSLGFSGKIIDKPPHNKDWNDDLMAINTTIRENVYDQTQLLTHKQQNERGLKERWNLQE